MIHCLDDSGQPITILDLCGTPLEEAREMLFSVRSEMLSNPKKWALVESECGFNYYPGVRVIIEHVRAPDRHPLEDPREHSYGLHPDFGFTVCFFMSVTDKIGPFAGVTRMMYVVQPEELRFPERARKGLRWLLPFAS